MEDGSDGRIAGGGPEGGRGKERVEMVMLHVSHFDDQKREEPTTPESPSQMSKPNLDRGSVIIHRLNSFSPTFMQHSPFSFLLRCVNRQVCSRHRCQIIETLPGVSQEDYRAR